MPFTFSNGKYTDMHFAYSFCRKTNAVIEEYW